MLDTLDIMFSRSSGDCAGFVEKVYAAFSNIRGGCLSLPFLCWIARTAHHRAKQPPLPLRCSISGKAGGWTLNRHERKSAPSVAVALYSAADQA